jgi:hypothetical protein
VSFLSLQSSNLFTYLPFKNLILWSLLLASPHPPQCGLKSEFSRHVGMMQQVTRPVRRLQSSPSLPLLSLSVPIHLACPALSSHVVTNPNFISILQHRIVLFPLQQIFPSVPACVLRDYPSGGTRESASLSNRGDQIESSFDEIVLKIKTTTSLRVCPISTSTIPLY